MEVTHASKLAQAGQAERLLQSLFMWSLASGFICHSVPAAAQSKWLAVIGHPDEPKNDVVLVEPPSKRTNTNIQMLNIRVNRSSQRSSWDNTPYRSYTSTVIIDCAEKSARYAEINFHMMPMWEGKSHKTSVFSSAEVRPMTFLGITPNPTERIIKAACFTAPP